MNLIHTKLTKGFLIALLLAACNSAWANAFVWKVSKDNRVIYIGGTIHLLAKSDYPLPQEYEIAYRHAKALVFEVDLRKIQTPSFQQHFLMQMRYPYGETLQQHLSQDVYRKLTLQLKKYGVDIRKLQNYRASLMSMNLTLLELKRLGLAGTGVDKYYLEKAIKQHKPILALETPKQHLLFMSSMGEGHENGMILHTLEENTHLAQIMSTMKNFWKQGDIQGFNKVTLIPFETEFPSIYRSIIVKRNQNWLPKIEYMIHTPPTEFILVGTLHLVGKHGLLAQLRKKGYQVQPVVIPKKADG